MSELMIQSAETLRRAGLQVAFPFDLPLDPHSDQGILHCQRALRILPGKRITALATWKNQQVVAKLFFHRGRYQLHGKRDSAGITHLHEATIPTPALCFSSDTAVPGIYAVLYDYLPETQTLQTLWDTDLTPEQRQTWIQQCLQLIANLHQQGLTHQDFHLDNFLVRPTTQEMFLIDGDQIIKQKTAVDETSSLANLALLFAHMPPRYDSLVLALFSHYEQGRQWQPEPSRLQQFNQAIQQARYQHNQDCLKKVFRECTACRVTQTTFKRQIIARPYDSEAMATLLKSPNQAFQVPRVNLLKNGNTCTLVETQAADHALVIKRYNLKSIWHALSRGLRPTRAAVSWRNAHHLQILRIPTAPPVALLEKRIGPWRRQAYFVMEKLPGLSLLDFMQSSEPTSLIKKQVGRKVIELFVLLHQAGLSHGDLKASNIMITNNEPGFIDLDSMRYHRSNKQCQRAWRRDLTRFMKNWQQQPFLYELFHVLIQEKGLNHG